MGGILGTSKNDCPNEGGDGDTGNKNDNKRQAAATTMTASASVDANEEPPSKKQCVEDPHQNVGGNDNGQNQQQWQKQQRDGKKTSNKKQKTKHMDPRILKVRKTIQEGCRTNDLASAMNAYEDALRQGIRIEAQSYYNLLNLCDGLDRDERKVHVGTPKQQQQQNPGESKNTSSEDPSTAAPPTAVVIDSKQRQKYVFAIKQRMQSKEVNLPLNETAYSAIVKILSKNKEFQKAEEILEEAETVQQCKPKLRLYASLLHAYCDGERLTDALKCWKRLRQRAFALQQKKASKNNSATKDGGNGASAFAPDGMDVTEREYLPLLRCAVRASSGGASHNNGSDLVMEDVLTRLAEDVPVPAKDTVSAIDEWFELQNKNSSNPPKPSSSRTTIQELLDNIRAHDAISEPSPRMGPVVAATELGSWTISRACSIDGTTGVLLDGCLKGHTLHPVPLSDQSFRDMTTMNESIVQIGNIQGNAHSKFQGGRKGKKRKTFSPEDRRNEWERFNNFLEQQVRLMKQPYDVVIDGANIGYFKQNFAFAPKHVDYEQIDWVVRHFTEKLGKKVLLVMHNRHFSRHMLPEKYRGLYDAWISEGILYKTPPGMNDDWFWMHAALKYKTLVVTNDEMRDHHFQMMAPKFFLRWKERHQIHFDFGVWEDETSSNNSNINSNSNTISGRRPRQVLLTYPDVYSRRIQRVDDGLVVPLTKRGDENRFLDGCHVASEKEPEKELYLCVRPKSAGQAINHPQTNKTKENQSPVGGCFDGR
jgi:ribonuclease P protein 3